MIMVPFLRCKEEGMTGREEVEMEDMITSSKIIIKGVGEIILTFIPMTDIVKLLPPITTMEEVTRKEVIALIPVMIIVILTGRVITMIAHGQIRSHSHRVIVIMITVTISLVIMYRLNLCLVADIMVGIMAAVSSVVV